MVKFIWEIASKLLAGIPQEPRVLFDLEKGTVTPTFFAVWVLSIIYIKSQTQYNTCMFLNGPFPVNVWNVILYVISKCTCTIFWKYMYRTIVSFTSRIYHPDQCYLCQFYQFLFHFQCEVWKIIVFKPCIGQLHYFILLQSTKLVNISTCQVCFLFLNALQVFIIDNMW